MGRHHSGPRNGTGGVGTLCLHDSQHGMQAIRDYPFSSGDNCFSTFIDTMECQFAHKIVCELL